MEASKCFISDKTKTFIGTQTQTINQIQSAHLLEILNSLSVNLSLTIVTEEKNGEMYGTLCRKYTHQSCKNTNYNIAVILIYSS